MHRLRTTTSEGNDAAEKKPMQLAFEKQPHLLPGKNALCIFFSISILFLAKHTRPGESIVRRVDGVAFCFKGSERKESGILGSLVLTNFRLSFLTELAPEDVEAQKSGWSIRLPRLRLPHNGRHAMLPSAAELRHSFLGGVCDVALASIAECWRLSKSGQKRKALKPKRLKTLLVVCKNFRTLVLSFARTSDEDSAALAADLLRLVFPDCPDTDLFALHYARAELKRIESERDGDAAAAFTRLPYCNADDWERELRRTRANFNSTRWRVSVANRDFALCARFVTAEAAFYRTLIFWRIARRLGKVEFSRYSSRTAV